MQDETFKKQEQSKRSIILASKVTTDKKMKKGTIHNHKGSL
jgi:hypothetical protein